MNVNHVNEAAVSMDESSHFICSSMEQSLGLERSSHLESESALVVEITKRWNMSNAFSKPRIFCLEHAMEIEELLCSEGGANVLVICHSGNHKLINLCIRMVEDKSMMRSINLSKIENLCFKS